MIDCPKCRTRWSVGERRAWLLGLVRDEVRPASDIARAVTALGSYDLAEGKLAGMIRKWAERHQLDAVRHVGWGTQRRPEYRVGDVLDLLPEAMSRLATRERKPA